MKALVCAVDILTADILTAEQSERRGEAGLDDSDRSGFPAGVAKARGTAEGFTPVDFQVTATEQGKEMEPA
jgi:hypothetical protein